MRTIRWLAVALASGAGLGLAAGVGADRDLRSDGVGASPENGPWSLLDSGQSGGGSGELVLFRLRDRVFRRTPGGRRATELFYGHVGELAAASAGEPQIFQLGRQWLAAWQGPLGELVTGHGADATLSAAQVQALLDYVAALKAAASPALRQAIEREEARLDIPSWIGLTMEEWLSRVDRLSCTASDTALCLNGGRFRVEAEWRTPQGRTGRAHAVPLTADTGTFWFFGEANVEAVVKVLDACTGPNPRFWVFAAGLTDVEVDLTVTDTASGEMRAYHNALRTPFQPIQDTAAFATCAASGAGAAEWRAALAAERAPPSRPTRSDLPPPSLALRELAAALFGRSWAAAAQAGTCTPGDETLCLQDGRFRITAEWQTTQGTSGRGRAVQLTPDTGYFWFFRDGNVEEVVKVLDGCALNQRFWVFAAGLTNVRVVTTITDTQREVTRTYINEQGQAFRPLQDTNAFATCP